MCGVYAYSLGPGSRDGPLFLSAALAAQAHRGPDGAGAVNGASAGIGMCRLRIRADLREPEPIPLDGDRYAAFNGEIYSDSSGGIPAGGKAEVGALIEAAGNADGMYAVALLDRGSDTIEVRRDPFGIKPLFARELDDGLLFSSESLPLLKWGGRAVIRREAIDEFLAFGRPLSGSGFLRGITHVPPGQTLRLSHGKVEGLEIAKAMGAAGTDAAQAAPTSMEIRAAIHDSVRRVLTSNRPLGVAVSGGLDSTIICAELNELGLEHVPLVSVRMADSADGIADVSQLELRGDRWRSWKVHQRQFQPGDYLAELRRAVRVFGEPTRMSSLPLYLRLADEAADAGITTLLLGEGADELFLGYHTYPAFAEHGSIAEHAYPAPARLSCESLLGGERGRRVARVLAEHIESLPGASDWQRLRAFELAHSLEPLLRRSDHALMQRSIEGRTPFIHGDVPRLAFGLSEAECLEGRLTKVALRKAYADLLPARYRTERKRNFRAPVTIWFSGELFGPLSAEMKRAGGVLSELGIRPEGLDALLRDVRRGDDFSAAQALKILTIIYWIDWLVEEDVLDEPDILAVYRPSSLSEE